jgi:hypothetical protein
MNLMKKHYQLLLFSFLVYFFTLFTSNVKAQCPGGYTRATLDWDNRDFLVSTGNYSPFVSAARAATQRFIIGTNGVEINYSGSITNNGEGSTHTADAGQDLFFSAVPSSGNTASIVLTFDGEVVDLRFSIYDIDRRQRISVNGKNASNIDVSTTLVKRNSATVLSLSPVSGIGFNPVATATNTSVGNGSHDGTIDVVITGPVKTVNISISNTGSVSSDELFLSSVAACVTSTFPNGYRNISRPFTGMPSYILTVMDNNFMLVDPATGRAKSLFTDPAHTNMNGLGYDPHKRILYYCHSLTSSPASTTAIYKYDVATETISTFVSDVRNPPLNIPLYEPGVTSGSASFYNGSLYFGIESSNSDRNSGRENTVWKIDFAADSITPIRASQVYAADVDNSGTLIHDWADIGVTNNGMLYDFNGSASTPAYNHYNMMTGAVVNSFVVTTPASPLELHPRQLAIDWQEQVYNQGGNFNGSSGFIVPYNYSGGINAAQLFPVTLYPGGSTPSGSWGDCSEAFRPTCDFGDAPATYDPNPLSPAVHERDTALKLGVTWDREWLKRGVTGIEDIDDGLAYVPIYAKMTGQYLAQVRVWNNTGANATLCAWFDSNGNGVFDVGEGIAPITISSMPTMQLRYLHWTGITPILVNGTYTYLRIRITSSANGMTAANPTGYFENGETEDYRVLVDDFPLSANLLAFNAKLVNKGNVKLTWTTTSEKNFSGFSIQRSADNINWITIGMENAKGVDSTAVNNYLYNDMQPLNGKSFYRLELINNDTYKKYSETRTITIDKFINSISIMPNPATDKISVFIKATEQIIGDLAITDMAGRVVLKQKRLLTAGENRIDIDLSGKLNSGLYVVTMQINGEAFNQKIIISNQ